MTNSTDCSCLRLSVVIRPPKFPAPRSWPLLSVHPKLSPLPHMIKPVAIRKRMLCRKLKCLSISETSVIDKGQCWFPEDVVKPKLLFSLGIPKAPAHIKSPGSPYRKKEKKQNGAKCFPPHNQHWPPVSRPTPGKSVSSKSFWWSTLQNQYSPILITKTVMSQKVQEGIIPSFQDPKLRGSDFL